jgi:hypothetical protein
MPGIMKDAARAPLLAAALALIYTLWAASPLVAGAQVLEAVPQLQVEPTRVFGLFSVPLPEGYTLDAAVFSGQYNTLVAAGRFTATGEEDRGYVAGINLETLRMEWRQNLEGYPVAVASESAEDPRWVAVGTTAGEIALVDVEAGSVRAVFYTATRLPVSDIVLTIVGDRPVIAAVDQAGFLYIYVYGYESWIEIGPSEESMAAYHLFTSEIAHLVEVWRYLGFNRAEIHQVVLAPLSTIFTVEAGGSDFTVENLETIFGSLYSVVEAQLLYRTRGGALAPASPGTSEEEGGITVTRRLFVTAYPPEGVQVVLPIAVNLEGGSTADVYGLYELSSENFLAAVPAGTLSLRFYYIIESVSPEGNIVGFECYSTVVTVKLGPREERSLGTVIMDPVDVEPINWGVEGCLEATGFSPLLSVDERVVAVQPILRIEMPSSIESFSFEDNVDIVYMPLVGGTEGVSPTRLSKAVLLAQVNPLGVPGLFIVEYNGSLGRVTGPIVAVTALTPGFYPDFESISLNLDYFGTSSTEVYVDYRGRFIIFGTSDGKVVLSKFVNAEKGFVKTEALVIDTVAVSDIVVLDDGRHMVAISDAGVMQLIDMETWTPLWRGMPELPGIHTGLRSPVMLGTSLEDSLIVERRLGEGEVSNRFYLLRIGGYELIPVYLNVGVVIERVSGEVEELGVAPGSTAAIVGDDGSILAVDGVVDGRALLYVPPGTYTLRIDIPEGDAAGSLLAPLEVSQPFTVRELTVELREVEIIVEAPEEAPNPEAEVAYKLFAGPKEGVVVEAEPASHDPALGYVPQPKPLSGVTDEEGRVVLVLWKGVEYRVVATAEFIEESSTVVGAYERGPVTLLVHPRLVDVVIRAVDADAAAEGIEYIVGIDAASIAVVGEEERRVDGIRPQGDVLRLKLPYGQFEVTVLSEGYSAGSTLFAVEPGSQGIVVVDVPLSPLTHDLIVTVIVEDELGLATGPLRGALVEVRLIEPPIAVEPRTASTDTTGRALIAGLRTGVYEIVVSDPVFGRVVYGPVELVGDAEVSITLEPEYVEAAFRLVDRQFGVNAVGSFTLTLNYVKTGAVKQIRVNEPSFALTLPRGLYSITIESNEGFYYPVEITIEVVEGISRVIPLEPVINPVVVSVVYNDEKAGIAVGGVPGALVRVELISPELPLDEMVGVTDGSGRAYFLLRPGLYRVSVESELIEPVEVEIEVFGEQEIVILATPIYGVLTIDIVDSELLVKLPTAAVSVTWLGSEQFTKTFEAQGGELTLELPLGSYLIEARLAGYYAPASVPVDLLTSEQRVTILMSPIQVPVDVSVFSDEFLATIGDEIVRFPLTPLAGATVTFEPIDEVLLALGIRAKSFETGPGGGFTATLRVGSYKVTINHPYVETLETVVFVREDVGTLLFVASPRPVEATLLLVDPEFREDSRVVAGALVTIISYNGVEIDFSFEYPGPLTVELPAGSYEIAVNAQGYLSEAIEFEARESGELVVELIPVKVQVPVSLTVITPAGEAPVLSGKVIFESVTLPLKNPRIEGDIDNGVAVLSLRPGAYTVYYLSEVLGITVPVASGVEIGLAPIRLELSFEPPKVELTVEIVDGQLDARVSLAVITVIYSGPFGSWTEEFGAERGLARIQVPPGIVTIVGDAEGYEQGAVDLIIVQDTSVTIRLTPILYEVEMRLVDPDGRPVREPVKVSMIHSQLGVAVEAEGEGPSIRLAGVRTGVYVVTITPLREDTLFEAYTFEAVVSDPGVVEPAVVTLPYRLFSVEIRLVDSRTGDAIVFPYVMTLERQGAAELEYTREVEIEAGVAKVVLPPGSYTGTLRAVDKDYYVIGAPVSFTVDSDEVVTIRLDPRLFAVEILVSDDRGAPVADALVRLVESGGGVAATGYTDEAGRLVVQVPFGTYVVEVVHPGFEPVQMPVVVPDIRVVDVSLEPTLRTLVLRYGPIFVGVLGLATIIVVIYRVRETIAERLLREEEYF